MIETKFKQTEVGLIPEDWEVVFIENTLTICSGKDYKHLSFGNVPVYGTGGLIRYVNKFLYEGATVCIGRKGTINEPFYHEGKIWTVDTLFYTKDFVNSYAKYLFYIFKRIDWYKYNEATGVPSLSKNIIGKINIALPPLPEQQRIADILTDIDSLLLSLDKLIAKKKAIKEGVMQQLLTGKKRLKGFKEPWVEKKLCEVAKNYTGLTYSPDNITTFGTLVLRSSNIQNGRLSFDDNVFVNMEIPKRALVKEGDLLVCVRNGSKNLIGKSAIIDNTCTNMAFGAFMTVLRAFNINQLFLNYYWQTDFIQRQIQDNLGATINQITNADIAQYKIFIPQSAEEQQIIAQVLSDMDSETSALEAKRKKYESIKQSMMQQLLTGKIRLTTTQNAKNYCFSEPECNYCNVAEP